MVNINVCTADFLPVLVKEAMTFDTGNRYCDNFIDFNDYGKSSPEKVREKILEIIEKEDQRKFLSFFKKYSIILFKNIDKITNQESEKLLLSLFNSQSDASL